MANLGGGMGRGQQTFTSKMTESCASSQFPYFPVRVFYKYVRRIADDGSHPMSSERNAKTNNVTHGKRTPVLGGTPCTSSV